MERKSSVLICSFAVLLWMTSLWILVGCKEAKEPIEPVALNYTFDAPVHFPQPVYDFEDNPVSNEKFELGRMLFYYPALSRDSTVSCSSCHQQFVAFEHSGHAKSHGIDNQVTFRQV